MKTITSLTTSYTQNPTSKRNLLVLLKFISLFLAFVIAYSIIFHFIMIWEGKSYSWITGVYWTLTVMSTLGFGDITFYSDLGKIFSIVVLLSGIVFLLVLLPFTFIEFFYEPWLKVQSAVRVPREVSKYMCGHVILTSYGQMAKTLIEKLRQYHYPYVIVLSNFEEALSLHDEGLMVVLGELDDPETYRSANVDRATLIATSLSDFANTSIAFNIREVAKKVPIVATARDEFSVDILKLAGCSRVLELGDMTGKALARHTQGGKEVTHIIGRLDELLIAEVNAAETPLVGKTLIESNIRDLTGITVVGLWERGQFQIAQPQTMVNIKSIVVLAGSRFQLDKFEKLCNHEVASAPVVIIGGGRVGRATAKALERRGIDYRIVEQLPKRVREENKEKYIIGNAANPSTLENAGIKESSTVIITTHDDDTNIYLAIYCRRCRPDIQIISRTTLERNIGTLRRAGCDFVLSYTSMGANTIFNLLKRSDILMVAEGLDVFKIKVPLSLIGKTIRESSIRHETGCSIIAIDAGNATIINPDPDLKLEPNMEVVLIGTVESESRFLKLYTRGDV